MIIYKYILTYGSPLTLLLGGIFGLIYFKYLNRSHRLLLLYLLVSLGFDFTARTMANFNNNNLILWPLLSIVELAIFSGIYIKIIKTKLLWIATAFGSTFIIYEIINIDTYNTSAFQPYSKVVSSFLIVFFILYNFILHLKSDKDISRINQFLNSIVLGYFALNIILLLPINFLINEKSGLTMYIWTAYLIITILFYTCLTVLICKNGKTRKRSLYGS